VTALNGSLYGSFGLVDGGFGGGGVYEVNASGARRILNAGGAPYGGLTAVNGVLYGTDKESATYEGVFSLTLAGKKKLVFDLSTFGDSPPAGELIYVNGELYGAITDSSDGDCFCVWGVEYKVSPSGTGQLIYRFTGASDDEYPAAGLVYLNGELYGTTSCYDPVYGQFYCSGTVFSLSPTGAETTLYRFKGGSDGIHPFASLVYLHGLLYGTTVGGGTGNNGVVFAISPSGAEHVVYRFKNTPDGSYPLAHLTVVGDALYGTTVNGGANGLGSIFRVTADGVESVVHSFSAIDAGSPFSYLTYHDGILYGTTGHEDSSLCETCVTGGGILFERKP